MLEVDIVKLVPVAVKIGSKPPPAKLLNVNVGVDFSIVTPPPKVALFEWSNVRPALLTPISKTALDAVSAVGILNCIKPSAKVPL